MTAGQLNHFRNQPALFIPFYNKSKFASHETNKHTEVYKSIELRCTSKFRAIIIKDNKIGLIGNIPKLAKNKDPNLETKITRL